MLFADALWNRKTTRSRIFGFSGDPFALRCHFLTDGNPAAGGGGGGTANPVADPAAGGAGGNQPDLIPRAEAKKAFGERDAAKKAARTAQATATLLATKLGIDVSDLELVETGDAENPFELKGDALEQITQTLSTAEQNKRDAQKKAGKWEDRERELNDTWTKKAQKIGEEAQKKLTEAQQAATKRLSAMEKFITSQSVLMPLRSALVEEGALPEAVDDAVELLDRRIKREVGFHEESGELKVEVTPLAEDGTPLLQQGTQKPATLKHLAAEYLAKKPHLKSNKLFRGPGAGGRAPAGQGGAAVKPGDRGFEAARKVFGESFVPKP